MQINSGYGDAKEERLQRILVDFKFTDYSHETLESVTVNLKDLFEEYGYIPKAKAIPIEWINKWVVTKFVGAGRVIDSMLDDWEQENARD